MRKGAERRLAAGCVWKASMSRIQLNAESRMADGVSGRVDSFNEPHSVECGKFGSSEHGNKPIDRFNEAAFS